MYLLNLHLPEELKMICIRSVKKNNYRLLIQNLMQYGNIIEYTQLSKKVRN